MRKFLLIIIAIFLTKCGSTELVFPVEPHIEFLYTDKDTIKEPLDFTNLTENNKLRLTISFQDGDGDLGSSGNNDYNFFVYDVRDSVPVDTFAYSLPNLTQEAQKPSIKGTITVEISGLLMRSGYMQYDSTVLQVEMIDREGHKSNLVSSGKIIILPAQ